MVGMQVGQQQKIDFFPACTEQVLRANVLLRVIVCCKLRSQHDRFFPTMIPSPGLLPDVSEGRFTEMVFHAPYKNITGQLTPSTDDAVRYTDSRTELFQITHFSAADPAYPVAVGVNPPVERETALCTKELILVRVGFFIQLPYY